MEQFVKGFHEEIYLYVHQKWGSLSRGFTLVELKKISILLYEIWKLLRAEVSDDRMYQGSLGVQKFLIEKYRE